MGPPHQPARQKLTPQPTSDDSSACASVPPRGGTPSPYLGVRPDPFWDNRSIFVRSKCGRLLQPGTYPVNGTIRVCAYLLRSKPIFVTTAEFHAWWGAWPNRPELPDCASGPREMQRGFRRVPMLSFANTKST